MESPPGKGSTEMISQSLDIQLRDSVIVFRESHKEERLGREIKRNKSNCPLTFDIFVMRGEVFSDSLVTQKVKREI